MYCGVHTPNALRCTYTKCIVVYIHQIYCGVCTPNVLWCTYTKCRDHLISVHTEQLQPVTLHSAYISYKFFSLWVGYGVRVPAGVQDFTVVKKVHTAYGAHPATYSVGTLGCFRGVKRAERNGNHPPSASAEAKNKWCSPSTPPLLSWRAKETLHSPLLKILRHGDGAEWRYRFMHS
jgi:hypothetical protein